MILGSIKLQDRTKLQGFQRTQSGLIAEFLFYKEPLAWVEGLEDIPFYQRVLQDFIVRLKPAGGKLASQKLIEELLKNNYPYIVVQDGDYEILEAIPYVHNRVIKLNRYSAENYLCEKVAIDSICRSYVQIEDLEEGFDKEFEKVLTDLENAIFNLLVLDIAHQRCCTGQRILPDGIECLLESPRTLTLSHSRIKQLCIDLRSNINDAQITEAANLLTDYTRSKRVVHVLRGSLVFSIVRHFIQNAVRVKRKRNLKIDNDSLRIMLSIEVWRLTPSSDHENLKSRLRKAVLDAQREREKWPVLLVTKHTC